MQDDWITKLHNRDYSFDMRPFLVCATTNLVRVSSMPASHLIGSGLCSGHHRNVEGYKSCWLWLGGVCCSESTETGVLILFRFLTAWSLFSNKSRRIQEGLHSSWSKHPAWSACRWCRLHWCYMLLYIKNYSKPGNPANLNDAIWVHVSPVSYYHILFIILFRGISPYQAVKSQFGSVLDSMPLGK